MDVHDFNYDNVTWWDGLFGTFKDTDEFVDACGFPQSDESRFGSMLVFRDVYQ
ncbi:MAG: hypothetical protein L0Z68_03170 [Gammaproteobacteria bacterium]|nr:hypothetical protein [Gammaproteobacteria bacterium]